VVFLWIVGCAELAAQETDNPISSVRWLQGILWNTI